MAGLTIARKALAAALDGIDGLVVYSYMPDSGAVPLA